MSQTFVDSGPGLPGEPLLGTMDAVRLGWRLLAGDFWQVWLAALVVVAILGGLAMVPCLSCLAPIANIFVWPPLMAGLFLVIRSRIDGMPVEVGRVFTGFRENYGQIVVAGLPVTLAALVLALGAFVARTGLGVAVMGFGMSDLQNEAEPWRPMLMMQAVNVLCLVIEQALAGIVGLLFMFAMLAVWENPTQGWAAAMRSMRLVFQRPGSALAFGLVFCALWLAAWVAGILALCLGWFFTMAVFQAWHAAACVYLYRSWTGRPLVQPFGEVIAESPAPLGQ